MAVTKRFAELVTVQATLNHVGEAESASFTLILRNNITLATLTVAIQGLPVSRDLIVKGYPTTASFNAPLMIGSNALDFWVTSQIWSEPRLVQTIADAVNILLA